MRTGINTVQQTLTQEAANILNLSIAEASRRNHGQTTPLHVASTLLAAPSGNLRQACIESHPNSSHPLQCRALELCFSVALDRLPSAQNLSPGVEPPISNALMAALKRAQAHQRRGCPEQQQQPLLAVKVELEHLIISILDDPSVSRVMREASFSSPAVKASIEQSLNTTNSVNSSSITGGLGFHPQPNMIRSQYLNPRLQPGSIDQSGQRRRDEVNQYLNPRLQPGNTDQLGQHRKNEVKKLIDILLKTKKRNPILVGDSEPQVVMKELLQKIEKRDINEGLLKNIEIVSMDKEFTSSKHQISEELKEIINSVETRINCSDNGGVILNLGDLKWLIEQPTIFVGSMPQQVATESSRVAVEEIRKLLQRVGSMNKPLWLVGTATCETYLRCQVYHPTVDNDWDLQAVPVTAKSPLPGLFPRLGGSCIPNKSTEYISPLRTCLTMANPVPSRSPSDLVKKINCCPLCMKNYEEELVKLVEAESAKSPSEPKQENQSLPQWLQMAKEKNGGTRKNDQLQNKENELILKRKTEELQKRWTDSCLSMHPGFHKINVLEGPPSIGTAETPPLDPKLTLGQDNITLQMRQGPSNALDRIVSPSQTHVTTVLALDQSEDHENKIHLIDLSGCITSDLLEPQKDKFSGPTDIDSFKRLFHGLMDKVGWQPEAASKIATTVIQCRSGSGKRRGAGLKGDTSILFLGPDRVGKKKMASGLSNIVFGNNPISIRLGSRSNMDDNFDNFRGKTVLDRIAEAVQRNPFSVIVLEGIDRADMFILGNIKRALEKGRIPDSYGREIRLGNVIFILTAHMLPENQNLPEEEKLASMVNCGRLELHVIKKTIKRRAEWLNGEDQHRKQRKNSGLTLSFDLNLAAEEMVDDATEGSRNSSDVTIEHQDQETGLSNNRWSASLAKDLLNFLDATITFKPIDFTPLRGKVSGLITTKYTAILGGGKVIQVESEALDLIVAGSWFGQNQVVLEEWTERVLVPRFNEIKSNLSIYYDPIVRLVLVKDGYKDQQDGESPIEWLPNEVAVNIDGL